MVGECLRAALRAGLTEAEFWPLTPYRLGTLIRERGRAKVEASLMAGWFAERFAREERLQGPQHYVRQFLEPHTAQEDAEALADAEFDRIARLFGSEVVDLEEDG